MGAPTISPAARNTFQPVSFAKTRHGQFIIVDGVSRGLIWNGESTLADQLGVDPPASAPTIASPAGGNATAGSYTFYYRYLDYNAEPVASNLSPVTTHVAATNDKFEWSALAPSSQQRRKYIQLWRTTAGQANLLFLIKQLGSDGSVSASADNGGNVQLTMSRPHYLAVGARITVAGHSVAGYNVATHVVTSVVSSVAVKTSESYSADGTGGTWSLNGYGFNAGGLDDASDATLNAGYLAGTITGMKVLNSDDQSAIADKYTVPPNTMSVAVQFQDRTFYGVTVRYTTGTVTTNGTTTLTGSGTSWNTDMVGRFVAIDGETRLFEITAVGGATSLTLDEPAATSASGKSYVIEPAPTERRKWYYSEPDLPEAVPATNDTIIQENTGDDDRLTAGAPHGSVMFEFTERHLYTMTFVRQPKIDIKHTLVASRGCFNQNCWDRFADALFVMDQFGPYILPAASPNPQPIGDGILNLWRDSVIDFSKSKWFFVRVDPLRQLAKFFVVYAADGTTRPLRSLDYHWPTGTWHPQKYPVEMGGGAKVSVGGQIQLMLGGENDLTLKQTGLTDIVTSAIRGTATAGGSSTLTDSGATFGTSGERNDAPVAIVAGTGKGQIRRIASHTNTVLTVSSAWTTQPSTDSVYVVGGIEYQFKTGLYEKLPDADKSITREVEMVFTPTTNNALCNLRYFPDHETSAVSWKPYSNQGAGWSIEQATTNLVVDLKGARSGVSYAPGYVMIPFVSPMSSDQMASRYFALEIVGFQGQDRIKFHSLSVRGAA